MSLFESATGVGSLEKNMTDMMTSSIDLFSPPTRDVGLIGSYEYVTRPVSENVEGPFNFVIAREPSLYIDTSSFRLSGSISLKKKTVDSNVWENIGSTDDISICNLAPASLFRNAEVFLNGVCVSYISTPMLAHKTFMETVLSYSRDAVDSHLECTRYYPENQTRLKTLKDAQAIAIEMNTPNEKRRNMITDGKELDFSINLHIDVLNIDRFILPNVDLGIILSRNPDDLTIQTGATSLNTAIKLEIKDLQLHHRKVQLSQELIKAHEQKLMSMNGRAMYPLTRTLIRSKNLPAGQSHIRLNNVYQGKIPSSIIVGFVHSQAITGSRRQNPFFFRNLNIKTIQLVVNAQVLPARPIEIDFNPKNPKIMKIYRALNDNLGIHHGNAGNLVSATDFLTHASLFAWDLSPDKCSGMHVHLEQSGNVSLEITFREVCPTDMSAIFHCSFDDVFEIDQDGKAYLNSNTLSI